MLKQQMRLGLILSLLLMLIIPTSAQFTDATILDFFGDCEAATVNYFSVSSFVRVRMTNIDTSDTLYFEEEDPVGSVTVFFEPSLADGTVVEVEVGQEFLDSAQITVECEDPIVEEEIEESVVSDPPFIELCNDGRTNSNLCEPIAIYPVPSAQGIGVDIWDARRTGSRGQLLYIAGETLQTLPETACFLTASADGFAQAVWLNKMLVIIAGPDDDNKTFLYVYENGFPSQPVIATSYGGIAFDLPACNA